MPERMLARIVEGVGVTVVYLRESVSVLKYEGFTNAEKMSRVVCVWCVYEYVHVCVCVCVISGWVCMCKGCTCTLLKDVQAGAC